MFLPPTDTEFFFHLFRELKFSRVATKKREMYSNSPCTAAVLINQRDCDIWTLCSKKQNVALHYSRIIAVCLIPAKNPHMHTQIHNSTCLVQDAHSHACR